MITEATLQWLWRYKKIKSSLISNSNKKIDILNFGEYNINAGPDFLNARIQCDSIFLAGSIEFHVNSSDWILHKHEHDQNYQNVILHVVWNHDNKNVLKEFGVETVELKNQIDLTIIKQIDAFFSASAAFPCSKHISKVPKIIIDNWLDRMVDEKFERKINEYQQELDELNQNWLEVFYRNFLKYLGAPLNSKPFYELGCKLPISILLKHSNNPFQIKALLLGVSGFFNTTNSHEIKDSLLKNEYQFLKIKYKLTEIEFSNWKFSKTRPANFPNVRINQISMLFENNFNFLQLINANNFKEINSLLSLNIKNSESSIGKETINRITINVIIPMMYLYGKIQMKDEFMVKAIDWLNEIPAEKNRIVTFFNENNISAKNAFESQGLINLYNFYCTPRQCLNCAIGNNILQKT